MTENIYDVVKIRGLEKTFVSQSEKLTVINNLDMTVKAGQKVVIVGESGSGKSTLLNIIGGLDKVSKGSVIVGKYNVSELDEGDLAEYRSHFLGLVFQFHYLLKDFTALENIFLPAFMAGSGKKEAMERAKKLLDDVGLTSRASHLPSELSGGERQRVAVARSLVNNPSLILADEPTGNLDPANSVMIGDLLFSMAEKYQKTLVLVTHDMSLSQKGDIRYCIKSGRLEIVK